MNNNFGGIVGALLITDQMLFTSLSQQCQSTKDIN